MKNVAFHTQIFCILSFRFFRFFSPGARKNIYYYLFVDILLPPGIWDTPWTGSFYCMFGSSFFPIEKLPPQMLKRHRHNYCVQPPLGQPYYFPSSCSTSSYTFFSFLSITINIINALIVKVAGGIESLVSFLYSINNNFIIFQFFWVCSLRNWNKKIIIIFLYKNMNSREYVKYFDLLFMFKLNKFTLLLLN